ncbi:STAS domain-containing protein [Streptomyces sp. G45]|uniref:STAS domain-containing protein n=1 Tax=Streptomyces sp. G45 TaxID=3406627 RepID=UPI003C15891E
MCPHPDPSARPATPDLFTECRVVHPHGELDLTTSTDFGLTLADARAGIGRPFLIVDLSDVTFMDGSALTPLCAAWADCRARHGWVRLVRGPVSAGLVLRATGLTPRFPWYASAQDAWVGSPSRRGPKGGEPGGPA